MYHCHGNIIYCPECKIKVRRESSRKYLSNNPRPKIKVKCVQCGKEFIKSRHAWTYCSKECYYQYKLKICKEYQNKTTLRRNREYKRLSDKEQIYECLKYMRLIMGLNNKEDK